MSESKAKKDTVIMCSLYRFGYDLAVIAKTEKEAKAAMLKEYKRAYIDWNDGEKPSREEINCAKDEMDITAMEFGKVEWR